MNYFDLCDEFVIQCISQYMPNKSLKQLGQTSRRLYQITKQFLKKRHELIVRYGSHHDMLGQKIVNPLTGRKITIGSAIYRRLINHGIIVEFYNSTIMSCHDTPCQNCPTVKGNHVCCIHGDQRPLLKIQSAVYAMTTDQIMYY